jgi:hypothetical protein
MQENDLDFAVACTQHEQWQSETREDFETFLQYNPQGCFIYEVEQQRVGMCVAIDYGAVGPRPAWRMVHGENRGLGTSSILYAIGSPAKG